MGDVSCTRLVEIASFRKFSQRRGEQRCQSVLPPVGGIIAYPVVEVYGSVALEDNSGLNWKC